MTFYQIGRKDGDSAIEDAQIWMEESKVQMESSKAAQRNLTAERERLAAAILSERQTGRKLGQELATTLKQLDRYEFDLELIRNVMANAKLKRRPRRPRRDPEARGRGKRFQLQHRPRAAVQ